MMTRINLRYHDLFNLSLNDVALMHRTIIRDKENELSHLYTINDRLAEWVVKAGDGLKAEFKKQDLTGKLIPNPFNPNPIIKKYPKNYSNKKEAQRILEIWKIKIPQ